MATPSSVLRLLKDARHDPALIRSTARSVRARLYADQQGFGLRRDLTVAHTAPEALIALTIRPLAERDVPHILEADRPDLPAAERWERRVRRHLLDAGFGTPYVAVTSDDEPAYLQWMFTASDNTAIARHFDGIFPMLSQDTVLLEGAFTPTVHRGKRIMSAAMSRIAELGAEHGARDVITFVGVDNVASLKGCERAGFTRHLRRVQHWRGMRQKVTFTPLPTDTVAGPDVVSSVPSPREPATRGDRARLPST